MAKEKVFATALRDELAFLKSREKYSIISFDIYCKKKFF